MSSERDVTESEAVEAMQAMALMAELASGLFPDGMPALSQLTWADERPRSVDATAPDPSASAEEKLQLAEARFRTLVEQIPAVTFMAVLGEGKNEVYVSPRIEEMLGYSQKEWLEDPFLWYWRLYPPDRVKWNEEFARGCRTGGPFRADCRFLARDGRIVWVHGEARLVRDEIGRPMFLQGIAFDISEIKNAEESLLKDAVQKAKSDEELAIARRVQTSILPRSLAVNGLEIAAAMVPAEDIGGDYYDVQPAPGGAWIGIGDVAGHGLNSGLVMLMVQAATAALTTTHETATPSELLSHLNVVLHQNIRARLQTDTHVTYWLARFYDDGRFVCAGAHEDFIIVRANGAVEPVRTPGVWLGITADIRAMTIDVNVKLEPGDLLVLYTDGITEARNAERTLYDLPRLCETIARMRTEPVRDIVKTVIDDVARWEPHQLDDRTLVILRYVKNEDRTTEGRIQRGSLGDSPNG